MSSSSDHRPPGSAASSHKGGETHDPNSFAADFGAGDDLSLDGDSSADAFSEGEFFDPDGAPAYAQEDTKRAPSRRPEARAVAPKLALDGEGPRLGGGSARATTEESMLLDLAIDRSSEPSQREVERHERATRSQMRFYRDPELLAEDTGDRGEPIALGFAALLAASLLFFGWVAWQNAGVLDFRDFGTALQTAVGSGAQEGSDRSASESSAPLPPPLEVAPDEAELAFRNLQVALHRASDGRAFALVDGDLRHVGGAAVRRAVVEVTLFDRDDEVLGTLEVPAGATLDDIAIDLITDDSSLDERLRELAQRAAALELTEGQRTPFRAIFPIDGPMRPAHLRSEARIVALELRTTPTCWDARAFAAPETEAPGEPDE